MVKIELWDKIYNSIGFCMNSDDLRMLMKALDKADEGFIYEGQEGYRRNKFENGMIIDTQCHLDDESFDKDSECCYTKACKWCKRINTIIYRSWFTSFT